LRVLPARKGRHGQRMWSNSRNRRPLEKCAKKPEQQASDLPSFGLQRQLVGTRAAG
jgi:hypothetical protein